MKNTYKWKDSVVFPDFYSVSTNGEVFSKRSNKELKPNLDKDGYLYYVLCVNGIRKTIKAHRLVAMCFIPNEDNKPAIDHINGIRTDNRVDNLRWVTNKENTNNPITLERVKGACMKQIPFMNEASIKRNYGRKITSVYKDNQLIKTFISQQEAANFIGISIGRASIHIKTHTPTKSGFLLVTEENEDND